MPNTTIPTSYTVNAQCQLTYMEPQGQADLNGYANPLIVTEILGNYHLVGDSDPSSQNTAQQNITAIEDVTWESYPPYGGFSPPNQLDINQTLSYSQWTTGATGENLFKIVYKYGGPDDWNEAHHPRESRERQIRITLATGDQFEFEIFVRGWRHLRVNCTSGGCTEPIFPEFNSSDGVYAAGQGANPTASVYYDLIDNTAYDQLNPAIRLNNIDTGSGVYNWKNAAAIAHRFKFAGNPSPTANANEIINHPNCSWLGGSGPVYNFRVGLHHKDADSINKVGLSHYFYHGRVRWVNDVAIGGFGATAGTFEHTGFVSSLFNMDPVGGISNSSRASLYQYDITDRLWAGGPNPATKAPSSAWFNDFPNNSVSPAEGARSYRTEAGYPEPALSGNPNGPWEPYWGTTLGNPVSSGHQGDAGLGAYRGFPYHHQATFAANAEDWAHFPGHDKDAAVNFGPAPPNDGDPYPTGGWRMIWTGGGMLNASHNYAYDNGVVITDGLGDGFTPYNDTVAYYTNATNQFNYNNPVVPLISVIYKEGEVIVPVPPVDPCAVTPVILDNTNTLAVNCSANGANDGTATVDSANIGGVGPFTFVWTDSGGVFGGNTSSVSGLTPGPYGVVVTDANGCSHNWDFSITEPPPVPPCGFIYQTFVDYGCETALAGFTADPASDTPLSDWHVYVTDPDGFLLQGYPILLSGATTHAFGLPAALHPTSTSDGNGTYTILIEDQNDPTGCFVNVTIPNVLIPTNSLTATATFTNSSAQGADDGTATALPSGGGAPFTYLWADGQTTQTATGLAPGTHTVTITDTDGCTTTVSVVTTEPLPMPLNAQPLDVCLNLDTGTFDFVDNNNYNPSGLTYPYKIAITIEHDSGIMVHPGTLASPDVFSDSDLAALRTYDATINYGTNTSINIPTSGPNYISDIYQITTQWNFTGTNNVDVEHVSYLNAQGIQLFDDLAINLNLTYSCAGDITSWDKTDYSINGIPYTLSRTHELFAPVASGLPSPAQSTGLNIINNDLYEGDWTSSVTSIVQWSVPQLPVLGIAQQPLCVTKTLYDTKIKTVSCYIDPCVVQHHSKKIKNKYDAAVCDRDIVKIKEYRFKYQRLVELLTIFVIGELGDCAEDYTELWKMLEITNIDKLTNPDCCGDPQINETLIADGKGSFSKPECSDTGTDSGDSSVNGGGGGGFGGDGDGDGCPCTESAVAWSPGSQEAGIYVIGDYVNFTSVSGEILCLQLWAVPPAGWVTTSDVGFDLESPLTDLGQFWNYIPCDGDGGSPTFGCTDVTADNYDSAADIEDGSCIYTIYGCTDPTASNYNPLATVDDGSCIPLIFYGCTDPTAINYNAAIPLANDDGSCLYTPGCTDPLADNYNSLADFDDGSCTYCSTPGCMDATAFNYNPLACSDDGSCVPFTTGCMDTNADNYDAAANTPDQGTCIYYGCTDMTASNYMAPITDSYSGDPVPDAQMIDDGSCVYPPALCTGEMSVPDAALENYLESIGYFNGFWVDGAILKDGNGSVPTVCDLTILNVSNMGIADATGLEAFVGLIALTISFNSIPVIDVSGMTGLQSLVIQSNPITSLDLSNNPSLKTLGVGGTLITSLDVSNNPLITTIKMDSTTLAGSIDVSMCTGLLWLIANNNPAITSIDLGSSINLNTLNLNAQFLAPVATIKVGSAARVIIANSLWTVANNSISTGTTFTV